MSVALTDIEIIPITHTLHGQVYKFTKNWYYNIKKENYAYLDEQSHVNFEFRIKVFLKN